MPSVHGVYSFINPGKPGFKSESLASQKRQGNLKELEKNSPFHHTLQSTVDFAKSEKFADLIRQHRLTDLLDAVESHWGYRGESAIALLSFLAWGGDDNA